MNDIEKRTRFEVWATSRGLPVERNRIGGDYLFDETYDAWATWQAALTPPEGYVLVPVEPTDAMQRAGAGVVCTDVEDIRQAWEAMLAARPEVK